MRFLADSSDYYDYLKGINNLTDSQKQVLYERLKSELPMTQSTPIQSLSLPTTANTTIRTALPDSDKPTHTIDCCLHCGSAAIKKFFPFEDIDGYEHAYLGTEPLEDKNYDIRSESAAVAGVKGQLWACNFLQPAGKSAGTYYFPDTRTGGGEGSYYPKNSSGTAHGYNGKTWVKLGVDQTCYAYFGATGADTDVWYVDGLQSFVMVNDEKEPALLGVAPMAGGTYLPGDPITVALVLMRLWTGRIAD